MDNRELLNQLIQKSDNLTAKQIIMRSLYDSPNIDTMLVKPMTIDIMDGKLDDVKDEVIISLLESFGHKFDKVAEPTNIYQLSKKEEDAADPIQNLYNMSQIEIAELRKANKEKAELLKKQEEQINELTNKLSGLYGLFNLTDRSALIEVSDDDINKLFVEYMLNGTDSLGDAFVTKNDNKTIIPKSYYSLTK